MRFALVFAALAAPALLAAAPSPAAAHDGVSHYDCQLHGFRPYSHRHTRGDEVIPCDRPAITGRFSTAAVCISEGLKRGGRGPVALGTRVVSSIPLSPVAPAWARADALNAACDEAMAGCAAASVEFANVECIVSDRYFAQ